MRFYISHFSSYDDFRTPIRKTAEEVKVPLEDSLFELPPEAPKRITELASCQRCGCQLSQYREKEDTHCRACQRALNPLFDKSA